MDCLTKTLLSTTICDNLVVYPKSIMCEKRTRKFKKGSHITRLREARRLQRMPSMSPPPTPGVKHHAIIPKKLQIMSPIDKTIHNKVILELAFKTVALMHKNKIIQQKIIDLQKETSEFVATLMQNPENKENRLRYISIMRSQATTAARAHALSMENKENTDFFLQMRTASKED